MGETLTLSEGRVWVVEMLAVTESERVTGLGVRDDDPVKDSVWDREGSQV